MRFGQDAVLSLVAKLANQNQPLPREHVLLAVFDTIHSLLFSPTIVMSALRDAHRLAARILDRGAESLQLIDAILQYIFACAEDWTSHPDLLSSGVVPPLLKRLRVGLSSPAAPESHPSHRRCAAAILMHLAEKFGAFLPTGGKARAECLSWLFWQMGSAPFLGGGFGHFYAYAPTKIEYAIDRYAMEVKRQLDVLDRHLAEHQYLAGDDYTIADMATWPWYGVLAQDGQYGAAEFLQVHSYTHVRRWAAAIAARSAVQRGRMVNRVVGDPASQLHERHAASDFETRTQDRLQGAPAAQR